MDKVRKKILMLTILIVAVACALGFVLYRDGYIIGLLLYDPYKYNYFCSQDGENCLTVITYSRPSMGDNPFKRYVVFGKKEYKIPIRAKKIEFPNDTGLVIVWESGSKCKIISNLPAEKTMELSKDIRIDIIYDNNLYEEYAAKFPNLTL
jgi:hypothetical protein